MVQLTGKQRVFIVRTYFQTRSYVEVRRLFQNEFPRHAPQEPKTIHRNVVKYNEHGRSLNRNLSASGRPRSGRSAENIDTVQEALEENPDSVVCRRNGLGLSVRTFNRICKEDLKWHPYKIRVRHHSFLMIPLGVK